MRRLMRNAWRGMGENARLPYRRELQRLRARTQPEISTGQTAPPWLRKSGERDE